MRVIHLNYSDINGGAARAAYRIHHALRQSDVDSHMWVDSATSGDWTVHGPTSMLQRGLAKLRPLLGRGLFQPVFRTENSIIHSPAIIPSGRVKALNNSNADIIHLHWVQGEMLSIAEMGRLRKPVVWTLHDMWAFCGAEHYTEEFRYREGYRKDNQPTYESGFDLNRWTWNRKRRCWRTPIHIVTPSRWLAKCVRESVLMRDWPVSVIPNPINTEVWRPISQSLARELTGLPKDNPILTFGALGGSQDPRKGFDLLRTALHRLRGEVPRLQLVIFGELRPENPPDLGLPIHFMGHLHDDLSLRILYSAADVFVLPSRQDNLPNTGIEALACGTPVVAFDTCGLSDVVRHKETGYLAKAFDAEDLAQGVTWVLSQAPSGQLRQQARAEVESRFDSRKIGMQYRDLYEKLFT